MSFLLESLGRGLLGQLVDAFDEELPAPTLRLSELDAKTGHAAAKVDDLLAHGAACLRDMRLADARRLFTRAIESAEGGHKAALGLACVSDEQGRSEEALQWLERARSIDGDAASTLFALGVCHERLGHGQRALLHYRKALAKNPRLRSAQERMLALAISGRDWTNALRAGKALSDLTCDESNILLACAALELQAGRPRDAVEAFQRALLVEPDSGDERACDDAELDTPAKLRDAIGRVEELVDRYPGVSEFRVHLGDLYVKLGDDAGAVEQYGAALAARPSFLEATVKLGTQHLRRQRYREAAASFNHAVELNDLLLTAFVGLGVSQAAAEMPLDARGTFDLAASLAPNSTLLLAESTRLNLKMQMLRSGEGRGALAVQELEADANGQDVLMRDALLRCRAALEEQPASAELHYRLGVLLRQTGDFAGSVESLQEATRLAPSYAKAHIKLGVALHEAGRVEEALQSFRRAIVLDETAIPSHYELALLFSQRNRFELTVERFEDAHPPDAALRANLTLALQNVGMIDRTSASWDLLCDLTTGTCAGRVGRRIGPPLDASDGAGPELV